jgi:hypothetical protein
MILQVPMGFVRVVLPEHREALAGAQRPAERAWVDDIAAQVNVAVDGAQAHECARVVQTLYLEIEIAPLHFCSLQGLRNVKGRTARSRLVCRVSSRAPHSSPVAYGEVEKVPLTKLAGRFRNQRHTLLCTHRYQISDEVVGMLGRDLNLHLLSVPDLRCHATAGPD